MRKLVCLLAVAILAAPAYGGDITFTAYPVAGQAEQFRIGYSATEAADVPSAFALWVKLTGSCAGTVLDETNIVSSSAEFDVHIDYASDDPCNYTIGKAGQHPLADPCHPGAPQAALSFFSICMGRLDPCDPAPQNEPCLVIIDVDFTGSCSLHVDIEADGKRGGVVGAAFGTVTMEDTDIGDDACPIACWEIDSQCYGDFDDNEAVNTSDWPTFRDGFGSKWGTPSEATYLTYICADLDHDGDIDTTDWPGFRDNFGTPNADDDCPMDCSWAIANGL